MSSINFYALAEDVRGLVHFILAETDFRLFESYSEFDRELREFRNFEELAAAFRLGHDKFGRGAAYLLSLWSPSVTSELEIERINLTVPGHSFRYCMRGIGLIHLHLGGVHDENVITDSRYSHWAKPLGRHVESGEAEKVDWAQLRQLSGRIQRYIRNKSAVAKIQSHPILPDAYTAFQQGLRFNCSTVRFTDDCSEVELL